MIVQSWVAVSLSHCVWSDLDFKSIFSVDLLVWCYASYPPLLSLTYLFAHVFSRRLLSTDYSQVGPWLDEVTVMRKVGLSCHVAGEGRGCRTNTQASGFGEAVGPGGEVTLEP